MDAFLSAVSDAAGKENGGAGRSGLGALDSALEAVSAVKVVEALGAIRDLLRAQSADVAAVGAARGVDGARATYLNLASLLAVSSSAASKKARRPHVACGECPPSMRALTRCDAMCAANARSSTRRSGR